MVVLKRLNGQEFVLNADQIESIEARPDTHIKLVTGKTVVVKNEIAEVVKKCIKYKQLCYSMATLVQDSSRRSE